MSDYLTLASDRLNQALTKGKLTIKEQEKLQALQLKISKCIIEIAVFGLVSCGKSSVINALQGKKLREIGATHGTTQTIDSDPWQLEESQKKVQIQLIDTPGLNEVNGKIQAELALEVAKQADLILFITAGNLTRLELEAIAQLKTFHKPMLLVFNKADLYPESNSLFLTETPREQNELCRSPLPEPFQSGELQKLIARDQIIFTAADPLPKRVRLQQGEQSTEIWEKPSPQIQDLKLKILKLLNQEGKALLALNAMRSLSEIQMDFTKQRLRNLPPLNTITTSVFVVKAIALGIVPSFWLDILIGSAIDTSTIFLIILWGYPFTRSTLIWALTLANNVFLANLGLHFQLGQIGWIGITTPSIFKWLKADLQYASNRSAKALIKQIYREALPNSLLEHERNSSLR